MDIAVRPVNAVDNNYSMAPVDTNYSIALKSHTYTVLTGYNFFRKFAVPNSDHLLSDG